MTVEVPSNPVVIAIKVSDRALADRVRAVLAGAPGVRLARVDEPAHVALVDAIDTSASQEAALTPREIEVLNLLAEGASNKTIARRLGISIHTAKFHVGSLLDKLDASGRTDAVAHAARLGVIQL
ncbi:MAG TPA: LuxR C-terminal-related transcriptional regulator [Casimicrobiaceae bacterium]|nr:LuxR C-terminal-related transcriptional regulator [Casimicrobiaceae bacterium]HXU67226.1 LuxR C-terminal-related transcriptional regulator [Casimicrobiaceae bacterium]